MVIHISYRLVHLCPARIGYYAFFLDLLLLDIFARPLLVKPGKTEIEKLVLQLSQVIKIYMEP